MAKEVDSAGVYFLSVEEFEWRPGRESPDEPAEEQERAAKDATSDRDVVKPEPD